LILGFRLNGWAPRGGSLFTYYHMEKLDYQTLIDEGKIRSFADLLQYYRREIIQTYHSRNSWPEYKPTQQEINDFKRLYALLGLAGQIPFDTYVLMMKEAENN
jgi:hypothetical protein